MEAREHLEAVRRESAAFAEAAERGSLGVVVRACPDWTLADLVWHLGEVQWFWTRIVAGELRGPDDVGPPPDRPVAEDLPEWFRGVSGELVRTLERADPGMRAWSWAGGEQDTAWFIRRQAHEAAVHRWDAQAVRGDPEPIEPALAMDGVDEFLEWMLHPEELAGAGTVCLRLAAIDTGDERTVLVEDGRLTEARDEVEVEATVRGTASDLDLLLWRRVPLDLVVEGERGAVERFLAASDLS